MGKRKIEETSGSQHDRSPLHHAVDHHDLQLKNSKKLAWGNSSAHPREWGLWTKTYTTLVICWLESYMTAISTSGAATADAAKTEYRIGTTMSYFAFITIYLLGQLIGGIACAPISEIFGRKTIYGIGALLFGISSVVTGVTHSLAAVFVGRFFQGVAAAIPATVAFGNFNDMFDAHARVWVVYFYTFAGMAGLALGPIYASYITELHGWRWVYHISAIVSGASLVSCIFMKESNADQILDEKVNDIKKRTGKHHLEKEGGENTKFSPKSFFRDQLYRPAKMLVTEPLVFFCAALCGIAFGLIYGLTEALTIVYTTKPFPFTQTDSSLAFIAVFIGIILDVLPRVYDDWLLKKTKRLRQRITPETKIRSFAIACPSLAIGLWIFAWTIPPRVTTVPWEVSMIGLICVGFSLCDFSYVLFGYISDSYGEFAASGASAISITRTIAAAVFPLFTTQMYNGLGANVATTILASVSTAFCITPWLFLGYGRSFRHRSKLAQDDEECLVEENKHLEDGSASSSEA